MRFNTYFYNTTRIKFIGLMAVTLFFICGFSVKTIAATNVYYSVGQNTTDHKTGTPTVTISAGTATFSVAQTATNMGVGDRVTYNGSSIAYISGKISSTQWTVVTATGTTPGDVTGQTVNSIAHEFASLNAAVGNGVAGNATSSTHLNTSDLVAGDYILNIPLYYDSGADTVAVTVSGFTTGASNYIRLYTPTNTSTEVNQSQRHTGKWDTTKWRLDGSFNFTQALLVSVPYTRIDGLQVRNTTSGGTAYGLRYSSTGSSDDLRISNNILSTSLNRWSALNISVATTAGTAKIWNNIIIDASTGIVFSTTAGVTSYIYNNTIYNTITGISVPTFGSQVIIFKNNLIASSTNAFNSTGKAGAGSDYNSTATSSMGYIVTGGGNTHDRVSQTFSFVDSTQDYHLAVGASGALDVGVDLSADAGLSFSTDIDGESRPYNSVWDIGADEYTSVDTTPPNRSAGLPTTTQASSTTSTYLSLSTNENATCKYSTVAGTAYGSMTNTFSSTGTTTHSTLVSGLSSGNKYYYYVRCQDSSTNSNIDDYLISFRVASAGTTYAESCLPADVNAAITAATVGDIVSVPAGTCTFTTSGAISVNKVVTLKGAGRGQTIYQIASTTSSSYGNSFFVISAAATVSSMTIRTDTTGNSGTAFGGTANGFRITDIEYLSQTPTSNGYFLYFSAYGLVDGNDITGGDGSQELIFGRGPTDSWQTDSSIGKKDNLFIENNIFRGQGYLTDCNSNSRCVLRGNITTGSMKADGHGKASNTPARGVRHMEIYNNTWTAVGSWTAMELRGGTGMIFSNTGAGGNLLLHEYGATNSWPNFGNVIQTIANYPIDDQIGVGKDPKSSASEPMYLWNNIRAGSPWGISLGYGNQAQLQDIIVADRDYYNQGLTFNGTSGIGRDILANRPATCTTGVGYWATDQGGNWDATNGTSNDGSLYRCSSTNTWTDYYVPYAYPHVFNATSTIGTNNVDIGSGARMFGNGKFYNIASTTGSLADISVLPNGGDENTWVDVAISTWINSGTRRKVWTESMPHIFSTSTVHTIGDLAPNESYLVKVDTVLGQNITGPSCTGGVCTSDSNGEITFTYSGGYSTHTFEVESGSAPADTTAPVITLVSPSATLVAGTTAATLQVTTDESSTCKYGTTANIAYASIGSTFTSTGGTTHSQSLTGLTNGTTYTYYVRCVDGTGNANVSDFTVSFSVLTEVVAQAVVSSGGGGGGGTVTVLYLPASTSTSVLVAKTAVATPATFSRNLVLGKKGADVLALQKFLNRQGFLIARKGPGSKGKETDKFGPATKNALIRFQKYYKIKPATGYFGPATRKVIENKFKVK